MKSKQGHPTHQMIDWPRLNRGGVVRQALYMVLITSIMALGCSNSSGPPPTSTTSPIATIEAQSYLRALGIWTPTSISSPIATVTPASVPPVTPTPTSVPTAEEQAILAVRRYFSAYSSGNSERLSRIVTQDSQAGAIDEMRLFQPHGISIEVQRFDSVDCNVTIERCIVIVTTTNEDILGEWTAPEALEVVKESGVWKVRWSL